MDESFRARVDKVFGSLASDRSSSSSLQPSPWSITGDEVERKEWRRCADTSGRDEMPCSSSFDEFLKKDRGTSRRRNFDDNREGIDDADENGAEKSDVRQEEWNIRSSIGMDRTLDYEEEEDEFDKVASGRESVGDRLYMRDVTETGSYLNSNNVLGNKKDPRANHLAAKFRLKEDEAETGTETKKLSSSVASAADMEATDADAKGSKIEARPKPILKRKDNEEVLKSRKRVRFDVGLENDCEEESFPKNAAVSDCETLVGNNNNKPCGVPDYLVNPSKYRCYSFVSTSEVNDDSEVKSLNRESGSDMENATVPDLPKSVTFIPKKKKTSSEVVNDNNEVKQYKEGDKQADCPVGIAIAEVQGEISGVEDDDDETEIKAAEGGTAIQNAGRRYRTMSRSDDSDT
ncbi:uncharacterized protein LOC133822506 [Humulus lupulus]|uniref:uncharacterized protein LOC133822506 n=1 Tax=Humulus lupulus TaxID=3486 RepID=UPI002B417F24|nr:uncharacterized protein LOC133822506 [Humulus lupulus]